MCITEPCEPQGWGDRIGKNCTAGGEVNTGSNIGVILLVGVNLNTVLCR